MIVEHRHDVVIVGAGGAGMRAAVEWQLAGHAHPADDVAWAREGERGADREERVVSPWRVPSELLLVPLFG